MLSEVLLVKQVVFVSMARSKWYDSNSKYNILLKEAHDDFDSLLKNVVSMILFWWY